MGEGAAEGQRAGRHSEVHPRKNSKTLIFPRFHQLDVVRKLFADVRAFGMGKSYLIQHSAGSGKSKSIAWTAYRLASLHDEMGKPVFSSVIIVIDRTVLDRQLQDTISSFAHTLGTVETIGEGKSSKDLRDAINGGSRTYYISNRYFELYRLNLSGKMPISDGRMLFITPLGPCKLSPGDESLNLMPFDSVLIPAGLKDAVLESDDCKVLMSSLPNREA